MKCPTSLPKAYQFTTEKPKDSPSKLSTKTHSKMSTEKSTAKLSGKDYKLDQDSLIHRRYWNQHPPEDFYRGRRIRGRKHYGERYGKTNTSESRTKRSTEMTKKKFTGRSPTLILNHITEKHLLPNPNDYGCIQQSMWKHSTSARMSTSALQYTLSITTY